MNCESEILEASLLTSEQLAILTVINLILMIANTTANTIVLYVLVKTKQILQTTCKLIFMLSASDQLLGVFCQNLLFVMLFSTKCSVIEAFLFVSVFLLHSSCYTVALIGVDRYLRIKHCGDFKNFWTTRVILKLTCAVIFLALLQAVLVLTSVLMGKEHISKPIYFTIDAVVIVLITFLQYQTIRKTNALNNASTVAASEIINKKVTKLSMRIMLLLCFLLTPHLIVFSVRETIRYRLNIYEKGILEFFSFMSVILTYGNSFANAVLFFMTNVKARRVLRNFRSTGKTFQV